MKEEHAKPQSDRWSYFWLFIGGILLIFSNGIHTIIPIATWLAPVSSSAFYEPRGK